MSVINRATGDTDLVIDSINFGNFSIQEASAPIELEINTLTNNIVAFDTSKNIIVNGGNMSGINNLTISGNFTVDSNVLVVNSTSNLVGIGTTDPQETLEINGTLRVGPNDTGDILIGANEIKLRDDGSVHFSLFNDFGRFDIRNTGAGGNLGTTGNSLISILDTGEVGIGTTNPTVMFDVVEDTSGTASSRFKNATAGVSAKQVLQEASDSSILELESLSSSFTTNAQRVQDGCLVQSDSSSSGGLSLSAVNGGLRLYTSNMERMVIENAGDVGVGTSNPEEVFHVKKDQNSDTVMKVENKTNDTASRVRVELEASSGTFNIEAFANTFTTSGTSVADGALIETVALGGGLHIDSGLGGLHLYTQSVERMVIDNDGDVEVNTGDLTVTSGEVFPSVCQSIGALGYILLDEQSTVNLTSSNYTSFTVDLDNQSTDNFAFYKIICRYSTPSTANTRIDYRFHDTVGEMAVANGHWHLHTDQSGSNIHNADENFGVFVSSNSFPTNNWFGVADYTLTLEGAVENSTNLMGSYIIRTSAGTVNARVSANSGLTSNETISTRITKIGFKATDLSWGFNIRVYRLL